MVVGNSIFYGCLLLLVLRDFIAPTFYYLGYYWFPPSSFMTIIACLGLAALPSLFLPLRGDRPGTVMLWVIYIIAYVPIQFVPVFSSGKQLIEVLPLQLSVLAGIFIIIGFERLPLLSLPNLAIPSWFFWAGISAFSLAVLAMAVRVYGMPTRFPDLADVYDLRAEHAAERAGVNTMLIFAISWQQKVINPLLMAAGIVTRNITLLAGGVIGQVLLFGISGQKSVFFSGLMVLAVLISMWRRGKFLGPIISFSSIGLVMTTAALDSLRETTTLTSLFIRRLIITPGLLTGYYYEYFQTAPHVRLSNSIFSAFTDYPLEDALPRVIGFVYFGRLNMSANANVWADGYAQFGISGILVFSLLLGLVILAFNSLALDRDVLITSTLAGMAAWTLTDTALFISLNTHGILFSLVVLYFLPKSSGRAAPRTITKNVHTIDEVSFL